MKLKVKNSSENYLTYENNYGKEIRFKPGEVKILDEDEIEFHYTDNEGRLNCGCRYLELLDKLHEATDKVRSRFELMIL